MFGQYFHKPVRVVMMGPHDTLGQGGIATVLHLYRQAGLFEDVLFLPTFATGPLLQKIGMFLGSLVSLIVFLLLKPGVRVLHLHSASRGSFLRKSILLHLGLLFGKKVIFHIHTGNYPNFYGDRSVFFQKWISHTLRSAHKIVILSESWRQCLVDICGRDDAFLLYNPAIIQNEVNLDRAREYPVFTFMGKICQNKGVYDLITVAERLKDQPLLINIYGDGELQEAEALVERLGVQKQVRIQRWVSGDAKERILQETDVIVLPSYFEGMPMVLLEAIARGIPAISTPVGGIPEVIIGHQTGLLVPPGDTQALGEAILSLATSKELRIQLGQNAYQHAKAKFSASEVITRLRALYAELGA